MTRKDYVAIADAFKRTGELHTSKDARNALDGAVARIADYCANDSPRFDRARFLTACGVAS